MRNTRNRHLLNKLTLIALVALYFATQFQCNYKRRVRSWGESNACCFMMISGRMVLCDFTVQYSVIDDPVVTKCSIVGPCVLGCDPNGQDPSIKGMIWCNSKNGRYWINDTALDQNGVYFVSGPKSIKKIGELQGPIEITVSGEWSGRSCAWFLCESLFNESNSRFHLSVVEAIEQLQ